MSTSQETPGRIRPWTGIIPAEEEAIYHKAGFGFATKPGKRPALLIIDVQYRSVGSQRGVEMPEALEEYKTSCGAHGWRAVDHISELLQAFRRNNFPVLYPHVAPKGVHDGGRFADKVPGVMQIPLRGYEFVAEVAPKEGDIRIPKHHASAFFGTPLASYLINLGVDTVYVAGCTTSGCVRATVVDASSLGFKVVVSQECSFDRSQVSHATNLFDMAQKYADVMPTADAIALVDAAGAR